MTSRILSLLLCLCAACTAVAQEFDKLFCDSTLRLDYVFSGNVSEQHIALDKLNRMPHWYGKRHHLAEVPVAGNGTITMTTPSGTVLYRQSFSTLFQEWLTYDEAKTSTRSFESVMLMPMPRQQVNVTVELRDSRQQVIATLTHDVNPDDILIRRIGERNVTPYETLLPAADTTNCIRIAFIAEGYTEAEMPTFLADAREAIDAIFAHEPFRSQKSAFNVIAVKSPSAESGTSEPSKGIWRKTALSSHFDTFYADRYLTTLAHKDLHDHLAGTPYEHIIVLVNTDQYGGGGILNSYNLSMTHHPLFRPVVVHEFGHSFAGLADEYAYEEEQLPMYHTDVEPWEPNITTLADFASKWQDMMPAKPKAKKAAKAKKSSKQNKQTAPEIGLHEGAGYSLKGVYRPCPDCRMRSNINPEFCPVCQRAILKLIRFYVE